MTARMTLIILVQTIVVLLLLAALYKIAHSQDNALTDRMGRACGDDVDSVIDVVKVANTSRPYAYYQARIDGEWTDVPAEAILAMPNYTGPPMLWRMQIVNGPRVIRCFIPEEK